MKIKFHWMFFKKSIKQFFLKKWGRLVEIGMNETGIPGHFDYFKNYIEIQLPLHLKSVSNSYKSLDKEILDIMKIVSFDIRPTIELKLENLKKIKLDIDEEIEKMNIKL